MKHRSETSKIIDKKRMQHLPAVSLLNILKLLACASICRVVIAVVSSYRDYMPPNFSVDFLQGREQYFFGSYQWAFYVHITSGPCTLIIGMILLSEGIRSWSPALHRCLGRIQVAIVLLMVAPSGLWMAYYAHAGIIAEAGFATLVIATAVCVACGWNAAVRRRFSVHRHWMQRCFALLFSAVVLRFIGGLATVTGSESEWLYPLAAWGSWLIPLLAYEAYRRFAQERVASGLPKA